MELDLDHFGATASNNGLRGNAPRQATSCTQTRILFGPASGDHLLVDVSQLFPRIVAPAQFDKNVELSRLSEPG
jgi:hypothetical protein